MKNETNIQNGLHTTVEGYYKIFIVDDKTNEVVWEQPELKKNLILNSGMDAIAGIPYSSCFQYACAGNGSRTNKIDPNGSVITQIGSIVYLTASVGGLSDFSQSAVGYSQSLQVGDVIQYGDGNYTTVIGSVSALSASVNTVYSETSQSFFIWKTSQVSLHQETASRTNNWLAGANGYSLPTTGSIAMWRTFDFTAVTQPTFYTEIGTSWTSNNNPGNIFSRILLSPTASIAAGQKLRLYYQMNLLINPTASVSRPNVTFAGWPVAPSTNTNASESIQKMHVSCPDMNGGITSVDYGTSNDPSSTDVFFISDDSQSLAPYGTSLDRRGSVGGNGITQTESLTTYTNGSYFRYKYATFSSVSWATNNLRSIGHGSNMPGGFTNWAAGNHGWCMVFDQDQKKSGTQTLTVAIRYSWGRTLSS